MVLSVFSSLLLNYPYEIVDFGASFFSFLNYAYFFRCQLYTKQVEIEPFEPPPSGYIITANGGNMEQLYMQLPQGNTPIDPAIIDKYHLEKGTVSPFNQYRIVGENGEFPERGSGKRDTEDHAIHAEEDSEFTGMKNGFVLSTSELIDLSQGTDSD